MPTHWTFLRTAIKWLAFTFAFFSVCLAIAGYFFLKRLDNDLPDVKQLHHVQYQIPLSIYSKEHLLIARFGEKKRIPVNIEDIPQQQLHAFIAAEDDRFYSHPGVDYKGLLRAAIQLILTGKKKQGGSTITMQVTRNFLLSSEKTYIRKIKEIILALKIEEEYSKEKILQLYLNKIYLGHRSYGISAAALTYYGKSLTELDLAQMAMIAGLPKAPSIYNPATNPERALLRRNYVLRRMLELEYINQAEFDNAVQQPVTASLDSKTTVFPAPYIAEMVRQEIYSQYGDKAYTMGLIVHTTITRQMQTAADQALQYALHEYDQRHGYRALPHNKSESEVFSAEPIGDTQLAHITKLSKNSALAVLSDNSEINLPWENIKWARPFKTRSSLGPELNSTADIFAVNDFIRVRQLADKSWALAQIPETEAAFVALNPRNGAILALSGGFDFFHNKFNRITQSKRQPGSGFKPIIYTTALEKGFTVASVINDAPVVVEDPALDRNWRPENYSHKFFGPTSLRIALRKSRNLISVRLARELGVSEITNTALRFGFSKDQIPNSLSLALGSGHATPLQMARVYATFANGGFLIKPYFIERIENNEGEVLFQADPDIACPECSKIHGKKPGFAPRIISSRINFLMNSLLRDVVKRGTATRAKELKRIDLAGKTGTTNEQKDTWFNGFTSDIVATAWLGFDEPIPLGRGESGGKTALPMWIEFMKTALKDKEEKPLQKPAGMSNAYINPETGLLAQPGSQSGIWEYFRNENIPSQYSPVQEVIDQGEETPDDGLF